MIRKTVSFGETSTHTIALVPQEYKNQVWYSGKELQFLNIREVELTKATATATGNNKSTMAQADLSWRGIESIQKGYSKEEKIWFSVHTVVSEYKRQLEYFGNVDGEELRQIAKAHSRRDRVKARKTGSKDAEASQKMESGKPCQCRQFAWFHKEMAAFRARRHSRVSALPFQH